MKHSVKFGTVPCTSRKWMYEIAPLGAKYSIISVTLVLPPGISEQQPRQRSSDQLGERPSIS